MKAYLAAGGDSSCDFVAPDLCGGSLSRSCSEIRELFSAFATAGGLENFQLESGFIDPDEVSLGSMKNFELDCELES